MAAKIKEHPPVCRALRRGSWSRRASSPRRRSRQRNERAPASELQAAHDELRAKIEAGEYADPTADRHRRARPHAAARASRPRSPRSELRTLNEELLAVPESFTIHRKLRKPLAQAARGAGRRAGSTSATPRRSRFASLLDRGRPRPPHRPGHRARHLLATATSSSTTRRPACATRRSRTSPERQAPFELHNSPLSEIACLGFEYGYSAAGARDARPLGGAVRRLRQRGAGDHRQFIVSGRGEVGPDLAAHAAAARTATRASGPEHSSARIERFLAARRRGQHPRRQPHDRRPSTSTCCAARRGSRKPRPLVVFTPKSLLRLPRATSTLEDLTDGLLPVRPRRPARRGPRREGRAARALQRQDLLRHRRAHERARAPRTSPIARVELLYPFAKEQLTRADRALPEPEGDRLGPGGAAQHGRLDACMPRRMPELLPEGVELGYVGRPAARQPRRGLPGRPHQGAGADRAHGPDGPAREPPVLAERRSMHGFESPPNARRPARRASLTDRPSGHRPVRAVGWLSRSERCTSDHGHREGVAAIRTGAESSPGVVLRGAARAPIRALQPHEPPHAHVESGLRGIAPWRHLGHAAPETMDRGRKIAAVASTSVEATHALASAVATPRCRAPAAQARAGPLFRWVKIASWFESACSRRCSSSGSRPDSTPRPCSSAAARPRLPRLSR